jgi:hypothetical protein
MSALQVVEAATGVTTRSKRRVSNSTTVSAGKPHEHLHGAHFTTQAEEHSKATTTATLLHPLDLTWENAWHGGFWTSPYDAESVGKFIFSEFVAKCAVVGMVVGGISFLVVEHFGIF